MSYLANPQEDATVAASLPFHLVVTIQPTGDVVSDILTELEKLHINQRLTLISFQAIRAQQGDN